LENSITAASENFFAKLICHPLPKRLNDSQYCWPAPVVDGGNFTFHIASLDTKAFFSTTLLKLEALNEFSRTFRRVL
jgi:hypothetical protein